MNKLFYIYLLLISSICNSQVIIDNFETVNGVGDYQITPISNTGSHDNELCYNLVGGYTNNTYYEALSPIYDFSDWVEVEVRFKISSSLRIFDMFNIFYFDTDDNNWYGWNLSNLNGTYTVNIPITANRISFDLNTYWGFGSTSGRFAHVDWIEITNNIPLPITLIDFSGTTEDRFNYLEWSTASEQNNHYFTLYTSYDGYIWNYLDDIYSYGNTSSGYEYCYEDNNLADTIYYKLIQTDYDGVFEELGIICLIREVDKVIKTYNMYGQEIEDCTNCIIIRLYESGKILKSYEK
jgi:hypothetical protein